MVKQIFFLFRDIYVGGKIYIQGLFINYIGCLKVMVFLFYYKYSYVCEKMKIISSFIKIEIMLCFMVSVSCNIMFYDFIL